MHPAKEIREKLGLTQPEFATLLGINLGLLAMAEIGKRSLPGSALLLLGQINQIIELHAAEPLETSMSAPAKERLAKWIKSKELEFRKAELQLEKLDEKLQQMRKVLAVGEPLKSVWPPDSLAHDQWVLLVRQAQRKVENLETERVELHLKAEGLRTVIELGKNI